MLAWGQNTDANGNPAGEPQVPLGLTNIAASGTGKYKSLAARNDTAALLDGTLPFPRLLNPGWQAGRFTALAQTLSRVTRLSLRTPG